MRTFCLERPSKIEVGHFGFMCFSFVNMLFFAYRLFLTRMRKLVEVFMTVVLNRSQQHGEVNELMQDTREDEARK